MSDAEQTAHYDSGDAEQGPPTVPLSMDGSTSGGLSVRCPHCQAPIALAPDAELESILCEACGSDFSLVGDEAATRVAEPVSQLGHFRLIERVGVGAFGAVWKAHDTQLDRTVR